MAIVKNFWLVNQTKKLGGAVIYQAMGQTRSRELAASVSNPRTESQMKQRVRWSNLVNLYRANRTWMRYAFETKKENQSEYNKFMSLNVASSQIFLTKAQAAGGGCVVAPYIITQGSLYSIETSPGGAGWYTNIVMPTGFGWDQLQTIGEFSTAVLAANPGIRQGDQLSFIRMTQQVNPDTGIPYVVIRKYEVIIDTNSVELMNKYWPMSYFNCAEAGTTNVLTVINSGLAGGFALILSRTISGKTYVSTQSIVPANNDQLINYYGSAQTLQAAIASYGENADAFLSTTTANEDSNSVVLPSILSIISEDGTWIPGERVYPLEDLGGTTITLNLSSSVTGPINGTSINVIKNGTSQTYTGTNPTVVGGNKITIVLPDSFENAEGGALDEILVEADDWALRAVFVVPNEATVGGLE